MASFILFFLLITQNQASQASPDAAAPATPTLPQTSTQTEASPSLDKARSLSKVRRIFVESFGEDPVSQQMQAMIISSLTGSNRFTVTEEKKKADAVLRGVGTEKTSKELHAYGSGTAVATGRGGAALQDSSVNTETVDSARASIRLVNSDGDVIWTTTQESTGAKFKGASADVADKIAKQLARDAEKADNIVAAQSISK